MELPVALDFSNIQPSTRNFKAHLKGRHNIIAEIKKKSPSAGRISRADVQAIARIYDRYANAVSVLTDERYFGGYLSDIHKVKQVSSLPVLRKDFIIDEVQIHESRLHGADALLLIASLLTAEQIDHFIRLARLYQMDCLVEVHTESELEMVLGTRAEIIGINNRDLTTFQVDIHTTNRLRRMIPDDRIVVSESGFYTLADIQAVNANAVLIGTALMKAPDISEKLSSLRRPKVKICGITCLEDALDAVEAGADYLGFNFYPQSPRYIPPENAREIIRRLPNTVASVGIFVNEQREDIQKTAHRVGLDMLQLHGQESAEYCTGLNRPVIKAFRVADSVPRYEDFKVFACLFDTYDPEKYGGTGRRFDTDLLRGITKKMFISGGLNYENITEICIDAYAVDVCSGVEREKGKNDPVKTACFIRQAKDGTRFGKYGGQFVPETLMPALQELETAYVKAIHDPEFQDQLNDLLTHYAGRPTPLYPARNFSREVGCSVYLKREDLLHGGAHKTNNVLGQVLLARTMGKTRIVAETGAGQHGVAVAMAGALFGIPTEIYMGVEDMERQSTNVQRMVLCGATVHPVEAGPGRGTLKDAVSESLRDWITNVRTTYYMLGSVTGPHPYPSMVRDLQKIIGKEPKKQVLEQAGRIPDYVLACVGGGSNAIGIFHSFLDHESVKLIGVEAGGNGFTHGATLSRGTEGIFQGAHTFVLQDKDGQILDADSIAAGLDYPGVGPQHVQLKRTGRVRYESVTDAEALAAFRLLARTEGIIPALESSHALAYSLKMNVRKNDLMVINLSGRGDKDLNNMELIK